jgi:hypothetical protein
MVQRRQQLGLALEARQTFGIAGENFGQELEGARKTSPMPPCPSFSMIR